jgi:hypothetical protein
LPDQRQFAFTTQHVSMPPHRCTQDNGLELQLFGRKGATVTVGALRTQRGLVRVFAKPVCSGWGLASSLWCGLAVCVTWRGTTFAPIRSPMGTVPFTLSTVQSCASQRIPTKPSPNQRPAGITAFVCPIVFVWFSAFPFVRCHRFSCLCLC